MQLAAALWRYWWWTRPLEGSDWLERVLAKPASTLSPERLEALIGSGFLLPGPAGPRCSGEEVLRHALSLALETGMAKEAARARYFLGELAISRGSPEEAEPLLNAALQAFEAMDAPLSAGWCHHALGWMAMAADDQRQAQDHFEQVFKLAHGGGAAELLRVHGMAALAPLAAPAGDAARAQLLAKAVMVARRLPAPGFLITALTRAGETALLSGRQPRATLRAGRPPARPRRPGVGRGDPRDGGAGVRGRRSAPSSRAAPRGLPGARGGAGRGGPGKSPLRRGERLADAD